MWPNMPEWKAHCLAKLKECKWFSRVIVCKIYKDINFSNINEIGSLKGMTVWAFLALGTSAWTFGDSVTIVFSLFIHCASFKQ